MAASSIILIGLCISAATRDGSSEAASLIELAQADYEIHAVGQSAQAEGDWAQTAPSGIGAIEPVQGEPTFGSVGGRYFFVSGGVGSDFGQDHLVRGGVGWSEFIARDFSLDLEINLLYFSQPGEDAVGANVNMLLRWHFLTNQRRTWSLYADAGAGLMLTTADVPPEGSSFDFTPQLGFGMSFHVESDRRLLLGTRWHHVSNANTFEDNPGTDSVLVYAMLAFPY